MPQQCDAAPAWGKASGPWRDVPPDQWHSPRWQLSNLVRTPDRLASLLNLEPAEVSAIHALQREFRFAISPYYFSLIDPNDPADPIRRMIVPSAAEQGSPGSLDPLAEKEDQVAPGLTHRYPDRVLLVVTSFCSSYCRFCIRKRNWHDSDAASSREDIDLALDYLRRHEEVRDVLISGGDPLTLPLDRLDYILTSLRAIPHLQIVRIGSREPVMLPMRIDDDLLRVLDPPSPAQAHPPLWLNTHYNHPREITEDSARACERLVRAGIPVNNQSVLLAGVNDDVETMKQLLRGLLQIRVRPYYLYQADPVAGTAHLRTSVWKGIELMESLVGHITGLAVPRFVVDAPGGGGKIPLMPNYIVSASPTRVVLRNFEGALFTYSDTTAPTPATPNPPQTVSHHHYGQSTQILPAQNTHYAQRKNKMNNHGNGNGNGHPKPN